MWLALIALLPLTAALQFPHIPSAQEALDAAGSILHPSAVLSHASDMVLSSVPTGDHLVITSALHPVSEARLRGGIELISPELQAQDQVAREDLVRPHRQLLFRVGRLAIIGICML